MPGDIEQQKELKELLSRAEVRTMQKDLALLREGEAEKEKERIIALKTEEETRIAREEAEKIKREEEAKIKKELLLKKVLERKPEQVKMAEQGEAGKELKKEIFDSVGEETKEMWKKEEEERKRFLARVQARATGQMPPPLAPQEKREELGTFIPKPPKRPSSIQKTLVRAVIILAVFFVASFSFWFFFIRQGGTPSPSPSPVPTPTPTQPSASSTEEIIVPESLMPIQKTKTIEVSNTEEIKSSLTQIVNQKGIEENGFTRILFKDTNNNKILGLKEFFTALEVKTPEGLLDKLDNDFTLFILTSTNTNRLGFIAKIEIKEGLPEMLTAWEKTAEKDTEGLFSVLGKEKPAVFPYFKTAHYKGNVFRYISFSPANFGLCWAIINDRFLFTSSGENMFQLINELTK